VPSDREFVAFVCEQLQGAGDILSRLMFGEAAVYLEGKVVGLVCDNQLFEAARGSAIQGVIEEDEIARVGGRERSCSGPP
jgi:TfoX/Sxy family transcriptional regulator of competence genes